jgi:heme/copper-type cytochrome/quinol oxidase subunit 1
MTLGLKVTLMIFFFFYFWFTELSGERLLSNFAKTASWAGCVGRYRILTTYKIHDRETEARSIEAYDCFCSAAPR